MLKVAAAWNAIMQPE